MEDPPLVAMQLPAAGVTSPGTPLAWVPSVCSLEIKEDTCIPAFSRSSSIERSRVCVSDLRGLLSLFDLPTGLLCSAGFGFLSTGSLDGWASSRAGRSTSRSDSTRSGLLDGCCSKPVGRLPAAVPTTAVARPAGFLSHACCVVSTGPNLPPCAIVSGSHPGLGLGLNLASGSIRPAFTDSTSHCDVTGVTPSRSEWRYFSPWAKGTIRCVSLADMFLALK
mmetsp:Transcript_15991/g.45792  ORF Transcript_15991/g.45792 Transcript_15991/m.45792 type:complete len:221 (+) Transcript_15991:149-811(+)